MRWWQIYLGVWLVAAGLSAVLTLACRRLAPCLGFLDRPQQQGHKKHHREVPVLGGLAMLLAWLIVLGGGGLVVLGGSGLVGPALRRLFNPEVAVYLPGIQTVIPQLLWIVCGAVALVVLGLVDDRRALSAATKLLGQFCVAGAVACYGVRVTAFWSHPVVTWGITTFWLLLVINALNFFDNMDGLAAGTATIAAFMFSFAAAARGQYFVAVLSVSTCGIATGFLAHNRPPATIFMGDAGSHLLGYLLAVIGALTTFYTPSESATPAPILIPVLVLGVPLFDAIAVVLMRLYHGKPVYIGDHTHISHRFTRLGLGRPQAVLVVYLLVFALGAGAVCLLWLPAAGAIIVLLQAFAILAVVSLLQFYGSEGENTTC